MSTTFTVLSIGYLIFCTVFISLILVQKKSNSSASALGGGSSYLEQTGGYKKDDKIVTVTKIFGAIFFAYSLLLTVL